MSVAVSPIHTRSMALPGSISRIIRSVSNANVADHDSAAKILRDADVRVEDLAPWADFNHPPEDSYGRKLVCQGEGFEIMVMSWRPGDYSAIHDHGQAEWGAVQIFGPAEHAVFHIDDNVISTVERRQVTPGEVLAVCHTLVHQMGNPTDDKFFLSLHIYGSIHETDHITADARIFDLWNDTIQRVNGGVFFALPEKAVTSQLPGPHGDFPTRLRYMVELIRRLRAMHASDDASDEMLLAAFSDVFSARHQSVLLQELKQDTDHNGYLKDVFRWVLLNDELKAAAMLSTRAQEIGPHSDLFNNYARQYDVLIGQPSLNTFISAYLDFFIRTYEPDFERKTVISLGCGTGLVEEHMISQLGVRYENMFGLDVSESMITYAAKRIPALAGDILEFPSNWRTWDIAYSGLNVFQYLNHAQLGTAIQKAADLVATGGYFVGDFVTPDHILQYPNVIYSSDGSVVSLRTPRLIEERGVRYQESEITNVLFAEGRMHIHHVGKHRRILPSLDMMRRLFMTAFRGPVTLYDAFSLEVIPEDADTCASTRYLVIAKKG